MPVYEYVCPHCKDKFERLRPMSDGQVAECPTCNAPGERVLSVFAAFSMNAGGDVASLAGPGCACAAGGACGCGS